MASAYREFHNTETALLKVHNDLLCAADKNDISILALLDLSAAFDHHILLERLRITMGLSGTVLSWFESYVTGRSQTVIVNCLQSSIFDVQFGVPQGSVLGPVLYTLYTTPLGKIIKEHNINYHMYADDTQLYKSVPFSDIQLLIQSIETCSGNVKKWMTYNKLKMNNEKKQKFCYVAPRNMLKFLIVIIFVSRVRISHFLTTQEIWGCILIAHFQWNIM